MQQLAEASADGSIRLPWEMCRSNFIQTASADLAKRTFERACPEPYRPVFGPVRLPRLAGLDLPTTFLSCRQDLAMPPGYWNPGMTSRLRNPTLVEIDGDHEVLLTAPVRLAAALGSAVDGKAG